MSTRTGASAGVLPWQLAAPWSPLPPLATPSGDSDGCRSCAHLEVGPESLRIMRVLSVNVFVCDSHVGKVCLLL